MGAGKLLALARARTVAVRVARVAAPALLALLALLASGCATISPSSSSSLAPGQTPGTGTVAPTVTPDSAPGLGPMSYGTFPASTDGASALTVCEQWAVLRDQYVGRLHADSPYQLEQWFSGSAWLPAFQANSPLKLDPDYSQINAAFGLVSTAAAASVASAKSLDKACAGAD
jgi:hypothetical protein